MKIKPIAFIRTPYQQKFAIPRQPNLVKHASGEIVFEEAYADPNCLRGIEQFSHLWLLFLFHETAGKGWSPLVQPPRLGGRENVGVFATRSTFRPNPIGLSVVENQGWTRRGKSLVLQVGGVDLLNGTPIIDIKPYIPYADVVSDATGGFADKAPGADYTVEFSAEAQARLDGFKNLYPGLKDFITAVLMQDPRPAWRSRKTEDDKQYGMTLYDLNIKWRLDGRAVKVTRIEQLV